MLGWPRKYPERERGGSCETVDRRYIVILQVKLQAMGMTVGLVFMVLINLLLFSETKNAVPMYNISQMEEAGTTMDRYIAI